MNKDKPEKKDYRVINVPYEFKNRSSESADLDGQPNVRTDEGRVNGGANLPEKRQKKPMKKNVGKRVKSEKNGKTPPSGEKNDKKISVIIGGKLKRAAKFKKLLAAAAVLLTAFIVLNIAIPIGLIDATGEFFAGFSASGPGFPLDISAASGRLISGVGSDVALLCDSTVMLYTSSGKQIYNRPHGFSNPAAATSRYRVLVYDRGGKGYKIERRRGTVLEGSADREIITAAIGDKGFFALATRSGDYVCDVTAFDRKGGQKCTWHSSERQVVALAVSDDGRYMGIGTVSGQGGKTLGGVLLIKTDGGTIISDQSFEGSNVVSLDFKGNTLVGVFDNMLTSITEQGVRTDFGFDSGRVSCFAQSSTAVAVTVEKYNDSANNQLMVFDKTLENLYSADIGAEAVSLSLSGNKVVVLSGEKLISFDAKGERKKEAEASADARQIITSGAGTAVLGSVTIESGKV